MRKLEKILEEFISACIKNGEFLNNGDSKNANKQYRVISRCKGDLKAKEEYGLAKITPYLEHQEKYVRLWTASILLEIEPLRSKEVLIELSKEKGNLGFTAEVTLSEWEKGSLTFDW